MLIMILTEWQCKQTYNPPQIKSASGYLVVDGFMDAGGDSTVIRLSRTQNLSDSLYTFPPEKGALINIVGQNGEIYPLNELIDGKYFSAPLQLNQNEMYSLKILRSNGEEYQSDYVPVKLSPAIDSINWKRSVSGVTIYANAHDDTDKTTYYRWEYIETWEYQSIFDSGLEYVNGFFYERQPQEQIYHCWRTDSSTSVLIASTEKLTADVVYEFPLLLISDNSQQLNIGYSILVKQYAITSDAFAYWQAQKLNTEQLGSIFGAQPSQLKGNIHCITHPDEPVIGYLSASSVQQQRMFIDSSALQGWKYTPPEGCALDTLKNIGDLFNHVPVTYTAGIPQQILYSTLFCADCRAQGGVNVKPSFWPN